MRNERLKETTSIEMEIELAYRAKELARHDILKGLGKEVLESALNVKMYAFRTSGGTAIAWRELEEIMYAYQDACQEKRK